jgi:transcriptional regulator with XRE-family HTH domain
MATAAKVGPVGERVAENVKRLRGREHVSVRELSKRLQAAGRPILPSGITKLEQGVRRVDVDDLVALADALGVSPLRLMEDPSSKAVDLEAVDTDGRLLDALRAIDPVTEAGYSLDDFVEFVTTARLMSRVLGAGHLLGFPKLTVGRDGKLTVARDRTAVRE